MPHYFGAPAASGTNILIAGVTNHCICVTSFVIQAAGTVTATFEDSDGTDLGATFSFQAREGVNRQARDGDFLFGTLPGKGLNLNLSLAVGCAVEVEYVLR